MRVPSGCLSAQWAGLCKLDAEGRSEGCEVLVRCRLRLRGGNAALGVLQEFLKRLLNSLFPFPRAINGVVSPMRIVISFC